MIDDAHGGRASSGQADPRRGLLLANDGADRDPGRDMARIVRDERSAVNEVQRDRNASALAEACPAGSPGHPDGMAAPSSDLRALVDRLATLAERRLAIEPTGDGARTRAVQLRDHAAGHLRVRAASLDTPLVVLLLGPTGAGKSSLFNAVAGRRASPSGVLRPTTRTALVLANPGDLDAVRAGALAGLAADRLESLADPTLPTGLALVDAPDVDSIDHANRALADQLVEAADLCIFVTTATRYADRVPWAVLARVSERGLLLVVVVKPAAPGRIRSRHRPRRCPPALSIAPGSARDLRSSASRRARSIPQTMPSTPSRPAGAGQDRGPARGRGCRRRLAADALAGSLAGVGPLIDRVADDVAHDAIDVAALRRTVEQEHRRALQRFVRTSPRARSCGTRPSATGRGTSAPMTSPACSRAGSGRSAGHWRRLRPSRPPVAEVREATTDDLVRVVEQHASEAARRTATAWADEARVAVAVGDRPDLWSASPDSTSVFAPFSSIGSPPSAPTSP